MLIRELQSLKTLSPILVTPFGMLMFKRDLQSEKALLSIDVTESGMLMLIRELQWEYLQPIITQYFIDNKSEIWLLFLIAHSKRWRFNAFIDY